MSHELSVQLRHFALSGKPVVIAVDFNEQLGDELYSHIGPFGGPAGQHTTQVWNFIVEHD